MPYMINDTQTVETGGNLRQLGHNGGDARTYPTTYDDDNLTCDSLDGDIGSPIVAAADGVVRWVIDSFCCRNVTNDSICGFTTDNKINGIFIEHAGDEWSAYFHIAENTAEVVVGEVVSAGDIIGYEGEVGPASAVHLHFAIYYGYIGPSDFSTVPARQTSSKFKGQRIPKICNVSTGMLSTNQVFANQNVYDADDHDGATGPCGFLGCNLSTSTLSGTTGIAFVRQTAFSISAENYEINPPIILGECDDPDDCTSPFYCSLAEDKCRNNGGSVVFRAGSFIELRPGFHAKSRSFFQAEVGTCK